MTSRTVDRIIRILSIAVGCFALWFVYLLLSLVFAFFATANDGSSVSNPIMTAAVFLFFFAIMSAFVVFCLRAAYVNWKHLGASNIRQLSAALAIGFYSLYLTLPSTELDDRSPWWNLLGVVSIVIAVVAYRLVSSWLINRSSVNGEGWKPMLRKTLVIISLLLLFVTWLLFDLLTGFDPYSDRPPPFPLWLVALVVPIVVAVVVYKVGVRLFCKSKPLSNQDAA